MKKEGKWLENREIRKMGKNLFCGKRDKTIFSFIKKPPEQKNFFHIKFTS